MAPINILHCIRQGQVGGGESHVVDLVRNLDSSKFKSFVLSFSNGDMISTLRSLNVQCFIVKTPRPFDFLIWRHVSKIILENQIHLVHVHGTRAFSNSFFGALTNRTPIVYTVHGWSFNNFQNPFRKITSILVETIFTKMAKVTINVSHNNKEIGSRMITSLHSEVIQNGIDLNKFSPKCDFKNIKKEMGIPKEKILIGFIGRMTEQKDPLTLLKSFQIINEKSPNIYRLLFVGEGELKNEVINKTKELGLEKEVHFENFRRDIPDILHGIDIFCLPSLWEGLSLGLLEAMAMGKTVIATEVDGTKEVIVNSENGFLFTPKDFGHLAQIVLETGENLLIRDRVQVNAIQTIQKGFSLNGMIRETQAVYLKFFQ